MPSYGLEWMQHWLDPEEDRAEAEQWKLDSKCFHIGLDLMDWLFFPPSLDPVEKPESTSMRSPKYRAYLEYNEQLAQAKERTKNGKKFCRGIEGVLLPSGEEWTDNRPCPVLMECLEYALAEELYEGVYGGTSGRERRKFRTELQRQVAAWRMRRTARPSATTHSSSARSSAR